MLHHASKRQIFLIIAQLLTLVASALGLSFLVATSGRTLFLFSAVAPGLVIMSVLIAAAVALYTFRTHHSLFDYVDLQPGDIIFNQGDPGDCAYFIQTGEVEEL